MRKALCIANGWPSALPPVSSRNDKARGAKIELPLHAEFPSNDKRQRVAFGESCREPDGLISPGDPQSEAASQAVHGVAIEVVGPGQSRIESDDFVDLDHDAPAGFKPGRPIFALKPCRNRQKPLRHLLRSRARGLALDTAARRAFPRRKGALQPYAHAACESLWCAEAGGRKSVSFIAQRQMLPNQLRLWLEGDLAGKGESDIRPRSRQRCYFQRHRCRYRNWSLRRHRTRGP
jgi:hypothetical protein